MVSVTRVYFNSLHKCAELLGLAKQEAAAVSAAVPLALRAAGWLRRGGALRGVVHLKHLVVAPHQPALSLAAYGFSVKGPVHTCGNSNYL